MSEKLYKTWKQIDIQELVGLKIVSVENGNTLRFSMDNGNTYHILADEEDWYELKVYKKTVKGKKEK